MDIKRHCHLILVDHHIGDLEHCREILLEVDGSAVRPGECDHRQIAELLHFTEIASCRRLGHAPALCKLRIPDEWASGAVSHIHDGTDL